MATFKQIIVRDRMSPVHLVMAGRMTGDVEAIMNSPQLVIALEALGRAYDHVIVDAGVVTEVPAEHFAQVIQVAVLVCERTDDRAAVEAIEQIDSAGFKSVRLLPGPQAGPIQEKRVVGPREAA